MYLSVQVSNIKEGLGGVGERMEEIKGVCRQLQSQLKNFPDCSETPFEAEADTLMDNWLDVRKARGKIQIKEEFLSLFYFLEYIKNVRLT